MATIGNRPPPAQERDTSRSLLDWMEENRRELGDCYQARIDGLASYVITHPEYCEHILRRNWRLYRKGSAIAKVAMLLGRGLMVSEGELWKSQRRMIQPAFHREAVRKAESVIVECNAALLRRWTAACHEGVVLNITEDISRMVLETTLRLIFGADYDECAPGFDVLSSEASRDVSFARALRDLRSLVIEVAGRRRRRNSPVQADMLDVLTDARHPDNEQPMSDHQLADEVLTLVVAGHETTAATLAWIWHLLSQDPAADARLHAELSGMALPVTADNLAGCGFMRRVIEEALRLYPAGWLMTRRALADDRLGPYAVPAGTEVYIPVYLIQRHPALWDDPDSFVPDRFDPSMAGASAGRHPRKNPLGHPLAILPFSAGPRNCIGEPLARLEMQVHVAMVARALRLAPAGDQPVEFDLGVNLRNKHGLRLRPIAR